MLIRIKDFAPIAKTRSLKTTAKLAINAEEKRLRTAYAFLAKRVCPNLRWGFPRLRTKGKRRVAERMAETLKNRYSALENYQNGGEKLLLLPVPMTEEKQRKRGYNQTQDIAEALQTTLEKAGFACELDDETLIKSKDVAEQKHLDFVSRAENVGSAYHLHKRKGVQNRVILLIDDIMTTGATGSACAEKLLNAGAREVILLTVASAPEKK